MKKIIYITLFCIGLFILFLLKMHDINNYIAFKKYTPDVYLKTRDQDDFLTSVYYLKKKLNDKEFDHFIKDILSTENMDLFSITGVITYLNESNGKYYLNDVKRKYRQLCNVPKDSIWMSDYAPNEYGFNEEDNLESLNREFLECIVNLESIIE